MHRSPKWSPLAALAATVALVFAACGGSTATSSPSASEAASAAPSEAPASIEPFAGATYPEDGSSACDVADYTGQMGMIRTIDALTVEFTLCKPDAAFLSKVAFSSLAIQDADYLEETGGGGEALVRNPNGTGPYKLKTWTSGSDISLETFPDYWGDPPKTPNAIIRWSSEAAQRLVELTSGNVDGIDNPGADDFGTIEANPELQLFPRTALNVMYLGMNNTKPFWKNEKIRQAIAMGVDRQRIVDTFYPPGSSVASHFTPCDIPGGCAGDEWYEFDPAAARELLAAGMAEEGITSIETQIHLRDVVRGYLATPVDVATDLQDQLKKNLGITATIDVQDATTYLATSSRGELDGIFILGWGADYPDVTNFLDVFFGVGADDSFGTK